MKSTLVWVNVFVFCTSSFLQAGGTLRQVSLTTRVSGTAPQEAAKKRREAQRREEQKRRDAEELAKRRKKRRAEEEERQTKKRKKEDEAWERKRKELKSEPSQAGETPEAPSRPEPEDA